MYTHIYIYYTYIICKLYVHNIHISNRQDVALRPRPGHDSENNALQQRQPPQLEEFLTAAAGWGDHFTSTLLSDLLNGSMY